MKQSVIWRAIFIGIVLVVWGASIFPFQDRPVLEVFRELAKNTDPAYETLIKEVDRRVAEEKLTPGNALERVAGINDVKLSTYIDAGKKDATNNEVVNFLRRKAAGQIHLGIDLRGGTEFIIAFAPEDIPEGDTRSPEQVRDSIIEIVRNRIDKSGVFEPEIKPIGPASISIKIPSVRADEINAIRKVIETQAQLRFHLVAGQNVQNPENDPTWVKKSMLDKNGEPSGTIYISRVPAKVTGQHVTKAIASQSQFGGNEVNIEFNNEGGTLFYEMTKANVNHQMAIVLDGQVYSAPNITEPIGGGRCRISGSFTPEDSQQLATVISSGNLPVNIDIQAEFSTDPSLGKDQVRSGFMACAIGLVLVVLFMGIYYTTSGVIADLALVANIVLVLGSLTIMRATMTLPGIAGIVLTIGMAVDANVLIFERIREELRNGKSAATAIRNGYDRAFSTILDANITTFLTALILYGCGSGPIRGFAVTLAVGILASMFTALFMTRVIFDAMLLSDKVKTLKMFSIIGDTKYDFMAKRKIAMLASAILILISLGVAGYRNSDALGVDFTGGTAISFDYKSSGEVATAEIRAALTAAGYNASKVHYQKSTGDESHLLEIVLREGGKGVKPQMQTDLNKAFPQMELSGGGVKEFGGLVGKAFRNKALMAMFWAIAGIIVYITFRFELSYALGAVIALVHDVIIGTGLFLLPFLGDRQLSLPVIAAILTIIGYSLNDTIVVFDRIRENIGLHGAKRKLVDILNDSVNETLSRTLLTSGTTLIVVVVLLVFGGGAINDFALIMFLGIGVGTYSSIFIATPIMVIVHDWQQKREAAAKALAAQSSTQAKSAS